MGKIYNMPFGVRIIEERPIVLHEGDIVKKSELKDMLQLMLRLDPETGMYVYRGSYDYPSGEGFTWHKGEKTLEYLEKLRVDTFRVVATPTGWYAEVIKD